MGKAEIFLPTRLSGGVGLMRITNLVDLIYNQAMLYGVRLHNVAAWIG
jgi:hypothetical protein